MKGKNILFIVQYPENKIPSQRFRIELYKELLIKERFIITTKSFVSENDFDIIFKHGLFFLKFWVVIKGFLNRLLLTLTVHKYDYIFLHREATPVGPPIFEWIYSKICRTKIIYDFDDAIWLPNVSKQNHLAAIFKNSAKVKQICTWAYKVSCGNQYLCDFAEKYNQNVIYNPTCVNTKKVHNIFAKHDVDRLTIGWTGSFSTMIYLNIVENALRRLQEKYDFDIKIISNQIPTLNVKHVKYIKWSEQNEIIELATCQIGIMPLNEDSWSEGKCGFKLIQYLALEIPSISSFVGVNKIIIEPGVNGFFAGTDDEWYNSLEKLLLNTQLRKEMGKAGRKKIIREYSVESNSTNFLNLFS